MRPVLVAAAFLASSAVTAVAAQQVAQIRLTGSSPIQVAGSGFAASDRVTVRVSQPGGAMFSKAVLATAGGRFVARFPNRRLDTCQGYTITATGTSGRRATRRVLIPPPCGIEIGP
jgi:hypothetical protein